MLQVCLHVCITNGLNINEIVKTTPRDSHSIGVCIQMNDYGSENSSDVIASQNCSSYNFTRASEEVLTIFAMLEFAIFILKLLLGFVVIYCLYRSKMLRDPVSALMISVAASLIILSIPLNLLVGLSVLIDQPPIGSCNIPFVYALTVIEALQWYLIPFSIGLIATIQFIIVKYGLKRVSTRNVLSAFALLMSFAMGFSLCIAQLGCGMRPSFKSLDCSLHLQAPNSLF